MMLKFRAVCSILVALSMLAAILAACSGSKGQAGRAENRSPQPPSATANIRVPENGALEEKRPEDYSGTLTLWGWDLNYYEATFAKFKQSYPHVKLEVTNVAARDYLQKLQTTLVSGGELPDLLVGEMDWRGRAFQLDIWENLEAAPYNFDRSLIFGYLPALNSKPNGDIVTIEQSVSPAALAYRRDLAKQYFGTDDPAELEAMFPTWDGMIDKGKDVRQKSGGSVYMFASTGELYNLFLGQNQSALLQNGELDVTGRVKDALASIIQMRDAGIVDKLELWSPQWKASFASGHHIFYPAANWSPQSYIKPSDPEGSGKWGLMMPPGGPFSWGGTAFGINKDSKNKELAWTFIEWLLLTKEGAEISKTFNYFIPLQSVYEDAGFVSAIDPYFGGQDVGRFWMEGAVPNLKLPTISEYDSLLTPSVKVALNVLNADPEATLEDVLPKMLGEVQAKIPILKVK